MMPRIILTCLFACFWLVPSQLGAQSSSDIGIENERFPPTGIGATTVGQRILLHKKSGKGQTWTDDKYYSKDEVIAITDHGHTVVLNRAHDPATGDELKTWNYAQPRDGQIQVLVSRAITANDARVAQQINCIPIITARNLSSLSLFRIVAELQFKSGDTVVSSTSSMFGPLDSGKAQNRTSHPVQDVKCRDITARLHIPFCQFANGLDCRKLIVASEFGAISLETDEQPSAQSGGTQKTGLDPRRKGAQQQTPPTTKSSPSDTSLKKKSE